jgi:ubiquinone biosynthesis protein
MLSATLEEFRKSMLQELDYLQEARNLVNIARNLQDFKRIKIPLPVQDYTTSRVLTMDYLEGKNIGNISPLGMIDIDGVELAEELFRAYLQQILVDGFFHADPHPGNVYITGAGEIALIDLGMTARVPEKIKLKLIRILIAISEGDGDKAAGHILSIGVKEEGADEDTFIKMVSEIVVKTYDNALQQIEVGRLVLEVTKIAADNGIRLPNEIVMLGKALLNLDRVGRKLDPDFDPNASLRRNAIDIMQKKMRDSFKPANFYDTLLETKDFLENLPGRVNKIFSSLAGNKFTIRVKVIDEKYFISGLNEAANRLTTGLILAALIVGAALLMRIDTTFRILGYPGLAILFFLLAAVGGLILVFHALFRND